MRLRTKSGTNLIIAGIDEAGRGPLAGPVTAACVVLPRGFRDKRITDSKSVPPALREELAEKITHKALAFHIVSVGPRRIESLNILGATILAMRLAARRVRMLLSDQELYFLVDGNRSIGEDFPHETIIKGDETEISISAASILAKVARDRLMHRIHQRYPAYGFASHKGYGAPDHLRSLAEHGPCKIHRTTFAPVRDILYPPPKQLEII
jgi:ribonuclease HII